MNSEQEINTPQNVPAPTPFPNQSGVMPSLPPTDAGRGAPHNQGGVSPFIENFGSETPSFYDGFTVKY
jgi:hypothetical protein